RPRVPRRLVPAVRLDRRVRPAAGRRVLRRGRDRHGGPAGVRASADRFGRVGAARPATHRPRVLPRERRRVDVVLRAHAAGPAARAVTDSPVTHAVTGASGAPYAVRLLRALNDARVPVRLVISRTGWRLLAEELDIADEAGLRERTGDWSRVVLRDDADRGARPATGSAPSRGMVICPCSMGTLASIAQGTTRSLIERAADVVLKERRRLILVPRETPYSQIHLENMLRLTRAGATVLPASPGFYHRPTSIDDLIDFVVGRVLAHLDVPVDIGPRWQSGERT